MRWQSVTTMSRAPRGVRLFCVASGAEFKKGKKKKEDHASGKAGIIKKIAPLSQTFQSPDTADPLLKEVHVPFEMRVRPVEGREGAVVTQGVAEPEFLQGNVPEHEERVLGIPIHFEQCLERGTGRSEILGPVPDIADRLDDLDVILFSGEELFQKRERTPDLAALIEFERFLAECCQFVTFSINAGGSSIDARGSRRRKHEHRNKEKAQKSASRNPGSNHTHPQSCSTTVRQAFDKGPGPFHQTSVAHHLQRSVIVGENGFRFVEGDGSGEAVNGNVFE
jgi:hypothetical protein